MNISRVVSINWRVPLSKDDSGMSTLYFVSSKADTDHSKSMETREFEKSNLLLLVAHEEVLAYLGNAFSNSAAAKILTREVRQIRQSTIAYSCTILTSNIMVGRSIVGIYRSIIILNCCGFFRSIESQKFRVALIAGCILTFSDRIRHCSLKMSQPRQRTQCCEQQLSACFDLLLLPHV
jgi:hypothetical protein